MKELTERQSQILSVIREYVKTHGYAPSIREIGEAVGIKSLRGVTVHLDALERKGRIQRCIGRVRAISILPEGGGPAGR